MNSKKIKKRSSYNDSFDVIICTIGRDVVFKKSLTAIMKNNVLPEKIIIVDQNISNTSINYAKKVFADFNYKNFLLIKNLTHISLTYSKNLGVKFSNSKFIFFIDDDMLLEKNYFKNSLKVFKTTKCHGVSGTVSNYKKSYLNILVYNFFNFYEFKDNRNFFTKKQNEILSEEVYHLPGGITGFKSSVFRQIKFDDKLIKHHYEDVDFNYRLKKKIKDLQLRICFKSIATDQLNNITREYSKRIYFMRLIYLKHFSLKFCFVYYSSLIGLILLNCFKFNLNFFFDLVVQIRLANKKYKYFQKKYEQC